jgi:hypothetical protein
MNKFIGLIITLIAFSVTSLLAQSPSPASSPATSPGVTKPRHKKKEAAASTTAATSPAPAASPATSPSVAKSRHKKKEAAASTSAATSPAPAEVSPTPAKRSWFKSNKPSPAPAASPAAAPSRVSSTKKTTEPSTSTPAPGAGPGMVWVNTETHVYHKEGSRWYGKTKKGKYMTEQDAMKEGDRADKEEAKKKP